MLWNDGRDLGLFSTAGLSTVIDKDLSGLRLRISLKYLKFCPEISWKRFQYVL